jgi:hypothetical protein
LQIAAAKEERDVTQTTSTLRQIAATVAALPSSTAERVADRSAARHNLAPTTPPAAEIPYLASVHSSRVSASSPTRSTTSMPSPRVRARSRRSSSRPRRRCARATRPRPDEVQQLVQDELDRANANYARVEQVKKLAILDHDLSVDTGELTPTLKVKRNVINERYEDFFELMYR